MIYDAIVIGSGAAAYSTADWLFKKGIEHILIVAERKESGTSRNTGSDKQTYYKLSLDGVHADSAYEMAKSIAAGGACDGEIAYIESVNSVRCFMRLIDLGIAFPADPFGGYVGYQTDHDNTSRATSVGPYTSKIMTEKLEHQVLSVNGTTLLDRHSIVKLLVKDNRCFGVIAYDSAKQDLVILKANYVIACTGAPACIYGHSSYPYSQHGMTGLLIEAGCDLCNFQEWQYGLSSTGFRWNVSGSFMQAIPRFVSVDAGGHESEFLTKHYTDAQELFTNIFLKGYEWPFSCEKASSKIDLLVCAETAKGNRVYLDYAHDPAGFDLDALDPVVKHYLQNCGALQTSPIERLQNINRKAAPLYLEHGIDIAREYLEIAVCAQHNNGGVWIDSNWQTSVKNLFAVGEVAACFGITRPGGSALNSTQAGGIRVAEYISTAPQPMFGNDLHKWAECLYQNELPIQNGRFDGSWNVSPYPFRMSECAGILRDRQKMEALLEELESHTLDEIKADHYLHYVRLKDQLLCIKTLLKTILTAMPQTGSRGGARFIDAGKTVDENILYRSYRTISSQETFRFEPCKDVPKRDYWFENIMNEAKE